MGRGRAKAKQQKVARRLKYSGSSTDLDRLAEELGVADGARDDHDDARDDSDEADRYSSYLDDEVDEGDRSR